MTSFPSRPVACRVLLGALLSAMLVGCGGPDYPATSLPRFACRAPREVVFEALVRRAEQLGYEYANVDPLGTQFAVYAHALSTGRRVRPARPTRRRLERVTDNLLIVEVSDHEVRVLAFGPHVVGRERMHPEVAAELHAYADAMRETSRGLRTGGLAGIVAPVDGAGGEAPSTPGAGLAAP